MTTNSDAAKTAQQSPGAAPTAAATETMTAIVQDRYRAVPEDAFLLQEMDRPTVGADDVLVQVRAAGLDRGTWHSMTGMPYLMRIMGFGFRGPKNVVPGIDVAGVVVAVGAEVTRFEPGDEVFGIARGSFAEYAAAHQDKLAVKPANLTFEQAAVVPVSGITALQALRDAGRVEAGQKVLVIGASGGVGTYAVQLAKAFEAEVTGVCSTSKLDLVRSIGADHALDYSRDDFADGSRRWDLIVDIGGNSPLSRLRRALTPNGTLVIVGGEEGGKVTGGFGRSLCAPLVSSFVGQRLAMHTTKERAADLDVLRPLIESGQVTPVVDRVYPLAQAPAAMRRLMAGQARGKIAITT